MQDPFAMDRGRAARDEQFKTTDAAHIPDQAAVWNEEAPTRPAPRAQPSPDQKVGEAESAADVVSTVRASTNPSGPPQSYDADRWYESIRPPIPSLPELILEPRENSNRRRWLGWIAMTVIVGASVWIVIAAAVVRLRAPARNAWLSYATPIRPRIAISASAPDVRTVPSTLQSPPPQASPRPVSSSPAAPVPSTPHRTLVQTQKAKRSTAPATL